MGNIARTEKIIGSDSCVSIGGTFLPSIFVVGSFSSVAATVAMVVVLKAFEVLTLL
jgi:hypothetical protein